MGFKNILGSLFGRRRGEQPAPDPPGPGMSAAPDPLHVDEQLHRAALIAIDAGAASVSAFQRRMKVGYSVAAHLVDRLEQLGIVGPFDGSGPRQTLISKEDYLRRAVVEPNALDLPETADPPPAASQALKTWDIWDASIHESEGQADRMRRAVEESIDILGSSGDSWLVSGASGSVYHTRFDGCDCVDYARRHLPCKHMYALAAEMVGFDFSQHLAAPRSLARWQDAVYCLEQLSDEDQGTVQQLLYQSLYHPGSKPLIVDAAERPELVRCPLLEHTPLPVLEKLSRMTKAELFALADVSGAETRPAKSWKKAELIAWAVEYVPSIDTLLPALEVATFARPENGRRKLYSYLLRKYGLDTVYDHRRDADVTVPHGATYVSRAGWVLPDDDIARLLCMYDHDRSEELKEAFRS